MYKICITEQSSRRQRELEQGLLSAMLLRQYEDISVTDLCRQMEIPRKAFYRYFDSKDGALHALIDHTLLSVDQIPMNSSSENANAVNSLESFFSYWKNQKALLDALLKSGLSGQLIQRSITQAVDEGSFSQFLKDIGSKEEQEAVVMFALSGLMSMVIYWHSGGFRETPAQMANLAAKILTRPIFKVPAKFK